MNATLETPTADAEIDYGLCQICFKPFTARSWDQRHSIWYSGEDCHAACCPDARCREKRTQRSKARQP
jgi:hypothetical protein